MLAATWDRRRAAREAFPATLNSGAADPNFCPGFFSSFFLAVLCISSADNSRTAITPDRGAADSLFKGILLIADKRQALKINTSDIS